MGATPIKQKTKHGGMTTHLLLLHIDRFYQTVQLKDGHKIRQGYVIRVFNGPHNVPRELEKVEPLEKHSGD